MIPRSQCYCYNIQCYPTNAAIKLWFTQPGLDKWCYLGEVKGSDDPLQTVSVNLKTAHEANQ